MPEWGACPLQNENLSILMQPVQFGNHTYMISVRLKLAWAKYWSFPISLQGLWATLRLYSLLWVIEKLDLMFFNYMDCMCLGYFMGTTDLRISGSRRRIVGLKTNDFKSNTSYSDQSKEKYLGRVQVATTRTVTSEPLMAYCNAPIIVINNFC